MAGLVDIAEAEKFCAPGANVSDLKESFAKLLLYVEVEILGIRRADILVRSEKIS